LGQRGNVRHLSPHIVDIARLNPPHPVSHRHTHTLNTTYSGRTAKRGLTIGPDHCMRYLDQVEIDVNFGVNDRSQPKYLNPAVPPQETAPYLHLHWHDTAKFKNLHHPNTPGASRGGGVPFFSDLGEEGSGPLPPNTTGATQNEMVIGLGPQKATTKSAGTGA
jgi:hypothetical protein